MDTTRTWLPNSADLYTTGPSALKCYYIDAPPRPVLELHPSPSHQDIVDTGGAAHIDVRHQAHDEGLTAQDIHTDLAEKLAVHLPSEKFIGCGGVGVGRARSVGPGCTWGGRGPPFWPTVCR